MKMTFKIDCTPEEARLLVGLPDVEQANAVYTDAMTAAMKGVSGGEQLERYARQFAPMGQLGIKLFQNLIENAMAQGFQAGTGGVPAKKDGEDGKPAS